MSSTLKVLLGALVAVSAVGGAVYASTLKPNIEEECVMNGLGIGECSFTNRGTAAGAICGRIIVTRRDFGGRETSSVFCSGEVETKSTRSVDFKIPAVRAHCSDHANPSKAWNDVCSFEFEAEAN